MPEECLSSGSGSEGKSDPKRKAELQKISEINAKVPAHKPDTFWEPFRRYLP